jgi:hypothetical protein
MRGKWALFAAALLMGWNVQAQVASLYVTSSSSHLSNVLTGTLLPPSGPGPQPQYTNFWTSGIGGGVTVNFLPVGPIKVGFDLRGSTRPGTTGADTAMAGLKVAFTPPLIHIKPYVQASGGYVATRTVNVSTGSNGTTFNNQYAAWEILGGVDIPLAPFLDLRAVEVGGGQGVSVLGSSNSPNVSLFTINSGLVLHF